MKLLLGLFLIPWYCVAWFIGVTVSVIISGYQTGWNYVYDAEDCEVCGRPNGKHTRRCE